MQHAQFIEYMTESILEYVNRQPIPFPPDAGHEVAQMALLREYVAISFAPQQVLSTRPIFDPYEVSPFWNKRRPMRSLH